MFHYFRKAAGVPQEADSPANTQRRDFLRYAGYSAATSAFLLSACKDADLAPGASASRAAKLGDIIKFGSGDIAVLNYAYALEQLEAAFYVQVINAGTLTGREAMLFTDIRDHEIAHREFFKNALGSARIPDLTVDFSMVNFKSRASIIDAAQAFEDTGVSAYNGAARFIKDAGYLTLAGKIVSVEARHAAYIRDLFIQNNFSNSVTNDTALDIAKAPGEVLNIIKPFVVEGFDLRDSGLIG